MAPFFSSDIRDVFSRLNQRIRSFEDEIVMLRDEQNRRENHLDGLLSRPNSEEQVVLLLQENDENSRQIITLQERISQMRRRVEELNLKHQVALCREEHQRIYGR
jgi:hypothetical protein